MTKPAIRGEELPDRAYSPDFTEDRPSRLLLWIVGAWIVLIAGVVLFVLL